MMRHLLPSGFSDLAPVSLLDTTKALLVAELAELRRLTPEQEVSAETVAQRIGEVAAAAEAAPEGERAAAWSWALFGGSAIE